MERCEDEDRDRDFMCGLTSLLVTPTIALWCECRWESLWISRVVGFRAEVSCGVVRIYRS